MIESGKHSWKEKRAWNRCAGIFVNDIMDAVPIDKYFELFKPGQGGEGGFIRIGMDYVKSVKEKDGKPAAGAPTPSPCFPRALLCAMLWLSKRCVALKGKRCVCSVLQARLLTRAAAACRCQSATGGIQTFAVFQGLPARQW